MLQVSTVEHVGAPTWGMDWRVVDGALRTIAKRRAGLDADEARWLREAEAIQVWRPLGMVNALDYLERIRGYSPRVGQERLRVARALGELPALEQALAAGELSYSAVRELTRVATRTTEDAWIRAACALNLRQIEELVAGRTAHRLARWPRPRARDAGHPARNRSLRLAPRWRALPHPRVPLRARP